MMKHNKILFGLGLVITLGILVFAYFENLGNINMLFVVSENSYAESYAKRHFLETKLVTTNEVKELTKHIETFEYQEENHKLTLTKYNGVSKRLVIPEKIDGKIVANIKKEALENTPVESIVIPSQVRLIEDEKDWNIVIECFKSTYCEALVKTQNVHVLNDSEFVDFNNSSTSFSYELKENEMEIVDYYGNDSIAVVPTTINGYEVTKLSTDSKSIIGIYIPATVKKIDNNFISKYFSRNYRWIVFVTILSFVIYCGMLLWSSKTTFANSQVMLQIVSVFYLFMNGWFASHLSDFFSGYRNYLFQSIFLTLGYFVISAILIYVNGKTKKFENKQKEQVSFLNDMMLLLQEYDEDDSYRLKEVIRYSDPVSIEDVKDIEEKIRSMMNDLNEENANQIKKLFQKRNAILKSSKS